jgi:WD40 repeat protein
MPGVTLHARKAQTELVARFRLELGDYVSTAEIARAGELAVVGIGDGSIVGIELETGRERFRQRAHPGGVLGISISPDGAQFVSCGQEPNAKVWSAAGELVRELPGGGAGWVEHVAWAPSGGRLATAAGRKLRVWSTAGEALVETEPMASTVSALAWRADGTAVAATCYGGVHICPFVPGAKARHLAWKGSLISLAWSPDAKVIACGSQDNSVHFWRQATGQDSMMSGYAFKPKALAWDSESKLLATSGDATATLWDFRGKGPEGTRPIQLKAHEGVITCLSFSPHQGVLASGSQDTSVLLWAPRRGTKPIRHGFLEDEVTALSWHPQHRGLLGGDASGNLCFWEVS